MMLRAEVPVGRDDRPVLLSYRALGLGDLLTAIPALRGLRAAFPRHRHVLATSAWLAPIVDTIDAVDDHLPVEELTRLPDSAGRPDVAVNLHGRGPESHAVLLAARPRRLIAFAHPAVPATRGGPTWVAGEHEVLRWCRMLAEHGITSRPDDLSLPQPSGDTPAEAKGATLIHPGAKAAARRWPAERFATVALAEARHGRRVVLTGSPGERDLAQRVRRAAGLPEASLLAGKLDLAAFARTVASAGRVVCGDTGTAHLATAYGTPSVVLFGPVPPEEWGPPPARADVHRSLWSGGRGDPLADTVDTGLLDIQPGDVLTALSELPRTSVAERCIT